MPLILLVLFAASLSAQPWDTPVKLWPHSSAVGAGTITVNWAQPIPPRMLYDDADVQVLANDVEITAYVAAIHNYRALPPEELRCLNTPAIDDEVPGIRAVHIQVERSFSDTQPVELIVRVGATRTQNQATPFDAIADTYIASDFSPPCEDPTYKSGDQCAAIKEPLVVVTHEPRWMACSALVAFASPMSWTPTTDLDAAQINWFGPMNNVNWNPTQEALGQGVVADLDLPCTPNQVRYVTDGVSATDSTTGGGDWWVQEICAGDGLSWSGQNGINGFIRLSGNGVSSNVSQHADGWQYDRLMQVLWIPYIRTGSPHLLREAIKETLYYEATLWAGEGRIESTGFWAPQNVDPMEFLDPKYSVAQPFAMLRYLYGDYRQDAVEDIEYAHTVTKPHMEAADDDTSTITTRDVANAAMALASTYEMTGNSATLTRIQAGLTAVAAALVDGNPSVPAENRGCHHYFESGQKYSSWKGAMLPISLAELYRVTADPSIPDLIKTNVGCLHDRTLYLDCSGCGSQFSADHVIASDNIDSSSTDSVPDNFLVGHTEEHSLDAAAAQALGWYFDQTQTAWRTAAEKLLITQAQAVAYWTRTGGWPANGLQVHRTTPIRRFNWWYRGGHAMGWLLYGAPDWNGIKVGASAGPSNPTVPVAPLNITSSATLPGGVVDTAYSVQLLVSGGTAPYTWTLEGGALPDGITLSEDGVLSGTPTTEETTNPEIQVADDASQTDSVVFTFPVTAAPVLSFETLTPSDLGLTTILADWKTALGAKASTVCGLTELDWNLDGWLDVVGTLHTSQGLVPGLMLTGESGGLTFVDGELASGISAINLPICDWGPYSYDANGDGYIDLVGFSDEQAAPSYGGQSNGTFAALAGDTGLVSGIRYFTIDSGDGYPVATQERRKQTSQAGTVSSSGTTVTRSGGTGFTTAFNVGDTILFRCLDPDLWRVVVDITDDDELTIDEAISPDVSSCAWSSEQQAVAAAKWDPGEEEIAASDTAVELPALVPVSEVAKVQKNFRDELIANGQTGTKMQGWKFLDVDYSGKPVDLNGDTLPDVVVSIEGHVGSALGGSHGLCINQGDGSCSISAAAIGTVDVILDLDGDGDQDLLIFGATSGQPSNSYGVFLNNGSGSFTHTPSDFSSNLHTQVYDNAYVFVDLDNDTDLDVLHYRGRVNNARAYRNDGSGVFVNVLNVNVWTYTPSGQQNNPIAYDFDRDGLVDVMLDGPGRGGGAFPDIDITLYHNTTSGAGNWCKVNLRQPGTPNPFAMTATFEWWPSGTRVSAGPAKWSLSPPWNGEPIHVGLAAGTALDYQVTWPDGSTQTADEVACENTTITVNKT